MSEPFIGEVKMFGGNFAPRGYAFCDGQLLVIAQNTSLFSVLGNAYGGDGRTTFALPNLQASAPMGTGQGPGLSPRAVGDASGTPTVTLTEAEMPGHRHALSGAQVPEFGGATAAAGNLPAGEAGRSTFTSNDAVLVPMAQTRSAGGGAAHNNLMPYLAVSFIVALQGIFPNRN